MSHHDHLLRALQPLSDTPLRPLCRKPGRLSAIGQVQGGIPAPLERLADPPLGARLVQRDPTGTRHRLDPLGAIVTCTWFGRLLVMQVPDVERFITGYQAIDR